jgi:hypothetical protein
MYKTRSIKSLRTGERKEIGQGQRKNAEPLTTREIDFVRGLGYYRSRKRGKP